MLNEQPEILHFTSSVPLRVISHFEEIKEKVEESRQDFLNEVGVLLELISTYYCS